MDQRIAEQYRKTLDTYLASVSKAFGDVGHSRGNAAQHKEYLVASTASGLQLLAASCSKALSDVAHADNLDASFQKFLKDSHERLRAFLGGEAR